MEWPELITNVHNVTSHLFFACFFIINTSHAHYHCLISPCTINSYPLNYFLVIFPVSFGIRQDIVYVSSNPSYMLVSL